jgi:endoglucanase
MFGRTRFFARLSASGAAVLVVAILSNVALTPAASYSATHTSRGITLQGLAQLLGSATSMGSAPAFAAQATVRTGTTRHTDCSPPHGWLETSGNWIVESKDTNCKIRLVGVTWYGMQSTSYALAGLNFQPYGVILQEIKNLGFNSIRIPLSDELVRDSAQIKIKAKYLQAQDPSQMPAGTHPLKLLDKIVTAAKQLNLMIILDNHFSYARNVNDVSSTGHSKKSAVRTAAVRHAGLTWMGDGYGEKNWIADWLTITRRYLDYPNVIGFDLRNEPHTNFQHHNWTVRDYLTAGATWGRCTKALCGKLAYLWNPKSDWVAAAETAGNAILKINPHLLMFVEGVQLYPDPSYKPRYIEPYWWGSILKGVATDPVKFDVPNHLVYSPHEWGPWKCCGLNGEFGPKTTYKSLTKIFTANWAYILTDKSVEAPIWLGEFNTCNSPQPHTRYTYKIKYANGCVSNTKPGSEGQWWTILMKFLQANPEISWSYFPLNGTNAKDEASNNSILNKSWAAPRLPLLMKDLRSIETQPTN